MGRSRFEWIRKTNSLQDARVGIDLEGKRNGASEIRRRDPLQGFSEVKCRDCAQKYLQGGHGDESREGVSQAEVRAVAESEVTYGATIDVVKIRARKFPPVPIGRPVGERNVLSRANRLTMQPHVACRDSFEALRGGVETQ